MAKSDEVLQAMEADKALENTDVTDPEATTKNKIADKPSRTEKGTSDRPARKGSLERKLSDTIVQVGSMVAMADPTCGLAMVARGPALAESLDNLAQTNRKVKRALDFSVSAGGWFGVILAGFPVITTILAHHGKLPERVRTILALTGPSMPSPEVLQQMQQDAFQRQYMDEHFTAGENGG